MVGAANVGSTSSRSPRRRWLTRHCSRRACRSRYALPLALAAERRRDVRPTPRAMPSTVAHRLESALPDPSVRDSMLSIFAESMRFIRNRKPDWCLVRFSGKHLRLFAGRLIVLTLHTDEVWLTTAPSAPLGLSSLRSWRWDTKTYARYRRIPSRNGYYAPKMDNGGDWPAIRRAHLTYLEQALTPGVAPDHRTTAKHDTSAMEYVDAVTSIVALPASRLAPEGDSKPVTQNEAGVLTTSPLSPVPGSEVSFTFSEVFPLIARLILQAAKDGLGEFVTHDVLVSQILADEDGAAIVARARTRSSWPDHRSAASNMVAWFSQQISAGRSEWIEFFERERIGGAWAYRPVAAATPGTIPDLDLSALEGEPRMFFHLRRERDAGLVRAKRAAARNAAGQLECEVCGFVAQLAYPGIAAEVCEVHHRKPLRELAESPETRLADLAVLCPNCHRAIHQTKPMLSLEEFRGRFIQKLPGGRV